GDVVNGFNAVRNDADNLRGTRILQRAVKRRPEYLFRKLLFFLRARKPDEREELARLLIEHAQLSLLVFAAGWMGPRYARNNAEIRKKELDRAEQLAR